MRVTMHDTTHEDVPKLIAGLKLICFYRLELQKTSDKNKRRKQAKKTSEENKRTKQANKTSEQKRANKNERIKQTIKSKR